MAEVKSSAPSKPEQQQQQQQSTGRSDYVLELFILGCICVLAFATRLFSVIRFESVIHEFDPWFNFRVTKYLVAEGFYNFHNWFDELTWYPLGRYIGGTVYPGLMWTAAMVHHILHALNLTVDIRNVCVLLAPFMASLTSIATYLLAKEVWTPAAGVVAAFCLSITPGYISRSVAGSYDNEAVAIFALTFTFFLWVKAVKTGSMLYAGLCALSYFYMVAAWGGYVFIINLIPFHVFVLLLAGRYEHRLYVSYCTFYVLGTLLSMNISFVSFIPVTSPEHLASLGIFLLLQVYAAYTYVKENASAEHLKIVVTSFVLLVLAMIGVIVVLSILGYIPFLTGRLLSLLGFSKNIAIVKSVSEHQPSPWTTFFFDFQSLCFWMPVGLYYCFNKLSDATTFMICYVLFSSYFASIMVRLVLVLAPGACVVGAIGISETLRVFSTIVANSDDGEAESSSASSSAASTPAPSPASAPAKGSAVEKIGKKSRKTDGSEEAKPDSSVNRALAFFVILSIIIVMSMYVVHCTWVTSIAYSSPSVVLQARNAYGRVVFDDFREAYQWLAHNTPLDAKILSWWDYGYQITGMGNRTVIVDNNTRNNTHMGFVATVGLAMASTEEMAYPILRALDVDYVLVVFGGMIGYSSDDINKFLWMVRISGGIYPRIIESNFLTKREQYRVDNEASSTMKSCLMYKMCYYRFGEVKTEYSQPAGFDRTRHCVIGDRQVTLSYLEEAYTTDHWMVRIYRVKKEVEQLGGLIFPKFVKKD